MQDRYAGDIGDFLKLGLMRHLARTGLVVGLNWYLGPEESHNEDGRHVAYLINPTPRDQHLRALDAPLARALGRLVAGGTRSVEALERTGVLPSGTPSFSERLERAMPDAARKSWHHRALLALHAAQVLFADPDNGIRRARVPRLEKYALVDGELAGYAHRGQSLVAYHHADRSGPVGGQARRRLAELAAGTGQAPVGALVGRRGSCRFFLVTADPHHRERLAVGLQTFAELWTPHVELAAP